MAKKKRKVRYDPLDKLSMKPPEPAAAHPLAHLHHRIRIIHSLECDGQTGLDCYNYLLQHPERTRSATSCDGPLTLQDELSFRRIVFFFGPDGKVMGELDPDARAQLAQIVPPISEADLIAIMEEDEAERLRQEELTS